MQTANSIVRTDVSTGHTYAALVEAFERALGRWNSATAADLVRRHASWDDVRAEADRAGGTRGLMIIEKIEQGVVISLSGHPRNCCLYLVGNPVIAQQIIAIDPRACMYVPFRVCLYDGGGSSGGGISFDRPSSFLAALNRPELAEFGTLLDGKIDKVVQDICGPGPS
jgi:Domain of unknown function DUF302